MKLTYTFKHMDSSNALIDYAEERVNRLHRYELKPYDFHFSFSMIKHERSCEVLVTGPAVRIQAHGTATEIYEALDLALEKVEKQLGRRKEKVQHHKRKQHETAEHLLPMGFTPDFKPGRTG